MNPTTISTLIEKAADHIGSTWPLYSFVTSNPLSGYEKLPFTEAVQRAKEVLGTSVYPKASVYQKALENGDINAGVLQNVLHKHGYKKLPEHYLPLMESEQTVENINPFAELDRAMVKWLSAFMDEGLAEWEMPFKSSGFYNAWRKLAPYDEILGNIGSNDIPKTSQEALIQLTNNFSEREIQELFTQHLAALPGWIGYIKLRTQNQTEWQKQYPIDLEQYLAVRLWTAKQLGIALLSNEKKTQPDTEIAELQHLWLKAWEKSWQLELVHTLGNSPKEIDLNKKKSSVPDAQLVFCIDTRSELIRRHVESKGFYETFGYAGFFGIAMDYENSQNGITQKSCPPILDSCYTVKEVAQENKEVEKQKLDRKNEVSQFWNYFMKRMKNMLPSTFGFVEGSGFFYGLHLMARTISPASLYRFSHKRKTGHESVCDPQLQNAQNTHDLNVPIAEQAAIVKSGFDLMGWQNFAPLVVFVGHGSHSANNPFGSSLDCGACAASPGRHNARMLAKMANNTDVRKLLENQYGLKIPDATWFLGAEHNTTTDEIELFDKHIPSSHQQLLDNLKSNLEKAQITATQERLGAMGNSVAMAQINASNWGETRPEWGLARNASFVIAPRKTTQHIDLDGRCFLHSYDWKNDKDGTALEAIMQGPMVVTQWINNHYYFSTVDNGKFGAGTKTTHNITGKFGVVQGNGGDLQTGLPWESLYNADNEPYHSPLRLTVVIQAPKERVNTILSKYEALKSLVTNEWIHLIIIDPEKGTSIHWLDQQELELKEEEQFINGFLKRKVHEELTIA
ncbi:DUF2309 domain-containing protein [Flagellimonas sp. MMG031]|uniref:Probable inorganic carbon transporter subunit DabA n=1 Tax=Flagellimonas sp. MMG031 TaxID=3158549 RepID=A0AAU7MTB4_9FLAO|nr:DUF2309 domain-containing protein [Allomuricauda sp.]MBO6828819.1 DUF2309 domain-containing protein [Allomuricauda sp.]